MWMSAQQVKNSTEHEATNTGKEVAWSLKTCGFYRTTLLIIVNNISGCQHLHKQWHKNTTSKWKRKKSRYESWEKYRHLFMFADERSFEAVFCPEAVQHISNCIPLSTDFSVKQRYLHCKVNLTLWLPFFFWGAPLQGGYVKWKR